MSRKKVTTTRGHASKSCGRHRRDREAAHDGDTRRVTVSNRARNRCDSRRVAAVGSGDLA